MSSENRQRDRLSRPGDPALKLLSSWKLLLGIVAVLIAVATAYVLLDDAFETQNAPTSIRQRRGGS